MNRRPQQARRWQRALLLSGALLSLLTQAAEIPREPAPWRIVVLRSTAAFSAAASVYDPVLQDTIHAGADRSVEFYPEALDSLRFPVREFEPEVISLLSRKYRDKKIDLVMTIGPAALDFMVRNGERLWPGAGVVFFSVAQESARARDIPRGYTGVIIDLDPAGTLALATRLQPESRRIVVVAGTSEYDSTWVSRVRSILERDYSGFEVRYLIEPLAETLEEVGRLPPDTIVLHVSMFRDGSGRVYTASETAKRIAQALSAPVYGFFDFYLGLGLVGGSVSSFRDQGLRASELALRVLRGENPASIPLQRPPPTLCTIDWRQLERWGMDGRRLPDNCVIQFREPSIWHLYRWHVVAAAVVMLIQAALIAALILQRRRRRAAELEVQRQRADLAHASRLTTLVELTRSIAHEVNQPLGAILANADAAEILLDEARPNLGEIREILKDIRNDDQRAGEVMRGVRDLLGKRELDVRPYDANALASEVIRLTEADARQRGIVVHTEFGAIPAVRGDKLHFQQVLLNLMMNAMEAMGGTPAWKRYLTVSTEWKGGGNTELIVRDTGPGIATGHMSRLFDAFFTTKKNSMGLGLALCRSIVEGYGGRIWAENNASGGASFGFTLPASPADAGAGAIAKTEDFDTEKEVA